MRLRIIKLIYSIIQNLSFLWVITFLGGQLNAGNSGILIGGGAAVPLGGLNTWYSTAPKFTFSYFTTPRAGTRILYETHFQLYHHGNIEDREFQWQIDYNYYRSPEARAKMGWNSFLLKVYQSLELEIIPIKSLSPFFSYGFGFYNYSHRVSGLIYPGQSTTPLNTSFIMDPVTDRRVAWGATFGIGGEKTINNHLHVILNMEYHVAIGYLRPFEDWGIHEVFPLQYLSVDLALGYSF